MRGRVFVLLAVGLPLMAATILHAQVPTGTLAGRVSDMGEALPGVTVSVQSLALQGTKTTTTSISGDYMFRFLPPGEYTVRFALESFRTLETTLKISAAQNHMVDAEMIEAAVSGEIVVTGSRETISSTSSGSVTYEQKLIENLPMDRDVAATARLAPGVVGNGRHISIAGGSSNGNAYMVNGAVAHDNVFRSPLDLYIEDAVLETTTQVSGVSAEYGRFTGGMVNMLTKSGGNQFSGSYRLNLDNDSWTAKTPLTTDQVDEVTKVHEATLGGYIWSDRLWFFLAARSLSDSTSDQFLTGQSYNSTNDQRRYEAKLTFSPHQGHRIIGSYFQIDREGTNIAFFTPLDPSALDTWFALPQSMASLNYTGVITDTFFIEAQYSERELRLEDLGGDAEPGDRINGTPVFFPYVGGFTNSYPFCAECGDETRSSDNAILKASLFLSTASAGSHDLEFGLETYNDRLFSQNYQTPSNFIVLNYSLPTFGGDGELYPMFTGYNEIDYWPIFVAGGSTDFTTNSAFVNDTWRLNKKLTVSLGLRWDENDGQNALGQTVADDSRLSPRIGATYDLKGDGAWLLHAGFGRYVEAIQSWMANKTPNEPSWFGYLYLGPPINIDENGNFVPEYTTTEALEIIFEWFDSVGGLANTNLWYVTPSISGFNLIVDDLASAYSDEITLGFTHRFGTRGMIRADYVHREYGDFYTTRIDLGTGQVTAEVELAEGVVVTEDFDLGIVVNDNDVQRREYDGLLTQIQYRFGSRLQLAANWTWAHLRGTNNTDYSAYYGPLTYPEYQREEWTYPTADISGSDVRHKVDLWAVWDAISSPHHNLSFSLLHSFRTGTPYGAVGRVIAGWNDFWIPNPGYISPPAAVYYWFTAPDAFRNDNISSTNISLNYSFFVNVGGVGLEIFVQPEVLNVFNNQASSYTDADVLTAFEDPSLQFFNPYEETPVEGVHWRKSPLFGETLNEEDYQDPRTFRVSLGIRF